MIELSFITVITWTQVSPWSFFVKIISTSPLWLPCASSYSKVHFRLSELWVSPGWASYIRPFRQWSDAVLNYGTLNTAVASIMCVAHCHNSGFTWSDVCVIKTKENVPLVNSIGIPDIRFWRNTLRVLCQVALNTLSHITRAQGGC